MERPKKIKIGGDCYQEKEKMLMRQNPQLSTSGALLGVTLQEMSKVKVKIVP